MSNRTRENQVLIRMTNEEYAAYQIRLDKSKLKKISFGIKCLLGQPITVFDVEGLSAIQKQLGAIGNNLNQIAKVINSGGLAQINVLEDLQKGVGELWQLLRLVKVAKR